MSAQSLLSNDMVSDTTNVGSVLTVGVDSCNLPSKQRHKTTNTETQTINRRLY